MLQAVNHQGRAEKRAADAVFYNERTTEREFAPGGSEMKKAQSRWQGRFKMKKQRQASMNFNAYSNLQRFERVFDNLADSDHECPRCGEQMLQLNEKLGLQCKGCHSPPLWLACKVGDADTVQELLTAAGNDSARFALGDHERGFLRDPQDDAHKPEVVARWRDREPMAVPLCMATTADVAQDVMLRTVTVSVFGGSVGGGWWRGVGGVGGRGILAHSTP